jgi:hypothetical protein
MKKHANSAPQGRFVEGIDNKCLKKDAQCHGTAATPQLFSQLEKLVI